MSDQSAIADWYAGQHILVTGATGFMGKVLVEKLLRSCPNIASIYLLIRNKKGKNSQQRLEDFLNCPIFDNLRDGEGEEIFAKLQCVQGDVTYENLNLNNQDYTFLRDNVTMVFHMAANVRFDQPLKPAVLMNTGGTKNVLDLVCNFKKLISFVHVSTSYCHCNETKLEEKLYSAPHNPRKILDMVKWMDPEVLQAITPHLLGNAPNTYAYTKALTEELVSEYSHILPIAIARPSIITAALEEPLPGWVDNLNGPTGLMVGAGKGVIRTMYCNPDLMADIVPVDLSINSLILIGWKRGVQKTKEVDVFHIVANKENQTTWGHCLEMGRKHIYNYPFSLCLWYPGGDITANYLVHILCVFFFHLIPAYIVDILMVLTRNKPFLVRTQKRIQNGLNVLQYYTTRPWYFEDGRMRKLYDGLSKSDQKTFYTNNIKLDWNSYILTYILGARKYCVHEEPATLPHARKVLKRLYYLDVIKNIFVFVFLLWLSFYLFKTILSSSFFFSSSGSTLRPMTLK